MCLLLISLGLCQPRGPACLSSAAGHQLLADLAPLTPPLAIPDATPQPGGSFGDTEGTVSVPSVKSQQFPQGKYVVLHQAGGQ